MIDIKKHRELLAAATPGPWEETFLFIRSCHGAALFGAEKIDENSNHSADAELIALLRNEHEALLDELEAARAFIAGVREWSKRKITRDYHPVEQLLDIYDKATKGDE